MCDIREILIEEQKEYDNCWIQDSDEILDSVRYNVYQGMGDSSSVKLFIQEEVIVEI